MEKRLMTVVKTAISIDRALFDAAEHMAHELHISRSELYGRALQDLLRRQRRQAIMDQINEVQTSLTAEERAEERAITEGLWAMRSGTRCVLPWSAVNRGSAGTTTR